MFNRDGKGLVHISSGEEYTLLFYSTKNLGGILHELSGSLS